MNTSVWTALGAVRSFLQAETKVVPSCTDSRPYDTHYEVIPYEVGTIANDLMTYLQEEVRTRYLIVSSAGTTMGPVLLIGVCSELKSVPTASL